MRHALALGLGLLILSGCQDRPENTPLSPTSPDSPATESSADISDSNNSGNPHFYWLPPVVRRPAYSGVALTDISPVVEICLLDRAIMACDPTSPILARFTESDGSIFDRVYQGPQGNYWVTWRRSAFQPEHKKSYRISVKVGVQEVGFFDVEIQSRGRWWNLHRREGFIHITDNGPFLFGFRVEEGALEEALCDPESLGIEDCDVQEISDDTGGVLRLFENPGSQGEMPAAVVVVPQNSALLNGEPISEYVVIAQLEDQGVKQGGSVPEGDQVPYFIDVRTEPAGIEFDLGGEGLRITLCQEEDFLAGIPEELHGQFRPFFVYSDGTTSFPLEYSVGAPECEGFGGSASSHHDSAPSRISSLTGGIARVVRMLQPTPLFARRLHGGLNTTVYSTRGDASDTDSGEGRVASLAPGDDAFVVEIGAVLGVDPSSSTAVVPNGEVGEPTEILIEARNGLGDPLTFGGDEVEVTVEGANVATPEVTDNGDGTYSASYIPTNVGEDMVDIVINGFPVAGSPYPSQVEGFGTISVEALVDDQNAPGIRMVLYGGATELASTITDEFGQATFPDQPYGDYTVQAASGYDFDVRFAQSTQSLTVDASEETLTFDGSSQELPANVRVWRIAEGGNGNAYEYVRSSLSWSDASALAQNSTLLTVDGHLATATGSGENVFVNGLRFVGGEDTEMRAWIGLSDEAQEGVFEWVTGETQSYSNWTLGEPNNGGGPNLIPEDFVAMVTSGSWVDLSEYVAVKPGHIVEWEVSEAYPAPPSTD